MKVYFTNGNAYVEVAKDYWLLIGKETDLQGASLAKVQALLDFALECKRIENGNGDAGAGLAHLPNARKPS